MKKILLLFTAFLLLQSAFAQTEDKKWGIGAGVGAYGNLNNSSIGFMPELYLSRYLSPRLDLYVKKRLWIIQFQTNQQPRLRESFPELKV